jgi:hypothetical protein
MRRLHMEIDGQAKAAIESLVEVLNGEGSLGNNPSAVPAANRLRQLCGDLEELERVRVAIAQLEPHATDPTSAVNLITGRTWAWPNWKLKSRAARELSASGERILERINALLKCLRTREAVMLAADARGLRLIRWHPIEPKHLYEGVFLSFVLELLESGNLYRLRRCQRNDCLRWLYAATDWHKYCSLNCRQRDAAQSGLFRKKRKDYMVNYRKDVKGRELRAKERVKKGRRK